MTTVTFQDGKVVVRDGKVGTEADCCCCPCVQIRIVNTKTGNTLTYDYRFSGDLLTYGTPEAYELAFNFGVMNEVRFDNFVVDPNAEIEPGRSSWVLTSGTNGFLYYFDNECREFGGYPLRYVVGGVVYDYMLAAGVNNIQDGTVELTFLDADECANPLP